jgi:hypothetical protein
VRLTFANPWRGLSLLAFAARRACPCKPTLIGLIGLIRFGFGLVRIFGRTNVNRGSAFTSGGEQALVDQSFKKVTWSDERFRDRVWNDSPPIARRWKIACDISLDQFLKLAESILGGV